MQNYRREVTYFVVVFAPPIFGGRGIMTKGVKLALKRSVQNFKQESINGIVVIGAYTSLKRKLVTRKMATFLQKLEVPEENIVQVPYLYGRDPIDSLKQKFSIENEHDENPRSQKVELRMIVSSNISEYFCIKTFESNGLKMRGYPEEVEVPFSFTGFLESCYYLMRNLLSGFARLIIG